MTRPGNPSPGLAGLAGDGQPHPDGKEARPQPSAAERARTLVESNSSLALTIPALRPRPTGPELPLRRSVGPDGDVFLLVPASSWAAAAVRHAADDEVPAVLEATDVAPVSVPHRVRGRAWVAGWLTPVPGGAFESGTELLRLEPGDITVDDLWGAGPVEPDEFADAVPDPLAAVEADMLQHLAASHPHEMELLCALLRPDAGCAGGARCADGPGARPAGRQAVAAVPLALDRFGLRVRFTGPEGPFDARFDFPSPVAGPAAARRALRTLFAAASLDG
ncbi:DUF2470 domain-containing protein [Actinacidiphila yeochonensis]|uniref:DUF2470 domain-containing protein n=1 Tax=Actinacidiphila yeochonensis TaxID=89050 RepID=UPI000561CD42|nr:DUF2470 domain-containing protein [Actinacidiphila yeochonensis]